LLYSVENNHDLIEFIDNVCVGNIRLALEFVTTFVGSGHVNTQKMLDLDNRQRPGHHYVVPLHEFLRAIMYGDNSHYDPQTSPIVNMFDITSFDGREHFILPILIDYVMRASSSAGVEGFVGTREVFKYAQNAGFTPAQIQAALRRALHRKLVEGEARRVPESGDPMPTSIRATTVGAYHATRLIGYFTYADAVVVDTPILDDNVRRSMGDEHLINGRLARASAFCVYLDEQWKTVPKKAVSFDWDLFAGNLRAEIGRIRGLVS
jgi:hypothetical protein